MRAPGALVVPKLALLFAKYVTPLVTKVIYSLLFLYTAWCVHTVSFLLSYVQCVEYRSIMSKLPERVFLNKPRRMMQPRFVYAEAKELWDLTKKYVVRLQEQIEEELPRCDSNMPKAVKEEAVILRGELVKLTPKLDVEWVDQSGQWKIVDPEALLAKVEATRELLKKHGIAFCGLKEPSETVKRLLMVTEDELIPALQRMPTLEELAGVL